MVDIRTSPKQKLVLCSRYQSKINQSCSILQILILLVKVFFFPGETEVELKASGEKRMKERVLSYPMFQVLVSSTDITSCSRKYSSDSSSSCFPSVCAKNMKGSRNSHRIHSSTNGQIIRRYSYAIPVRKTESYFLNDQPRGLVVRASDY